ncbi:MAG: hypothetical protein Q4E67_06280, partial [Planctomycetia bacterium]|nr:hypothetical protein [Planctomycetia bacterium]
MVRSFIWQMMTIGIVLICGGGAVWGIDYNDGGTHIITGSTEAVNISNATTVQVKTGGGSYPFDGYKVTLTDGSTLTTNFTDGNTGEILGGATVSVNASTIELTNYTANYNGITLADGAVLTIGNAGNNAYGALLGNGGGGINVTSGTASVNLYQNINATEKVTSFASLRNGNYKINVSQGATLEWLGGIQAHDDSSETLDANVVVNGAGTLILKGGEIGGRYVGDVKAGTTSAGELAISGGGTVTFDGASVYEGSKITVTGTGSTLNAAKAGSFKDSGEITINAGGILTTSVREGLSSSGKIVLNGGTLKSDHYTTISNGLELNGGTITGKGTYENFGSFLFSNALTVTGGTSTTPSTSTMEVVGARFRSTIDVAEYTTLNYSGEAAYDRDTGLIKTGKGTWNVTSGTFGTYYSGAWPETASAGTIHVQEGTLALNGAKFYTGSTVNVVPQSDTSSSRLEVKTGNVGSKIAYKITGTAGSTTPNAILSVTGNDSLYQNFGTIELTNAQLTASAYTTIDSLVTLKNGQIISTVTNPHNVYGSFLINGEKLSEGQCVINATEGTSLIQAGGVGIRLRTNANTSSLAVAKKSTTLNVADGAVLNVAASLTYDCTLTDETANASHGIYKSGDGLWNQTTGTVGGFCTAPGGTANAAGKVFVEGGTLRMSGDSTF